ncbi:SAM-dependent methyltransferase [Deinococcus arboris]
MSNPLPPRPELLRAPQFPRSQAYDPAWIIQHEMGPHALWLTEWLCEVMHLRPGMRVLDLACGRALSSIFLAREFGVQVWATDLWISATDNAERIRGAALQDQVFPIHADARHLPFADEFFDAILCIDAFEYFGTDASFLPSLIRYLKPGHQVGIVNAGVQTEMDELPGEWPPDFAAFHTPAWWRRHWTMSRTVQVERAEQMPGGRALWMQWNEAVGSENSYLTTEAGAHLGFHRVVARRTG